LVIAALLMGASGLAACTRPAQPQLQAQTTSRPASAASTATAEPSSALRIPERESPKARKLAEAAARQVGRTTGYDASYVQLDYPGGDVPVSTGVCSDVVVRAFRDVGVDLQVRVHEDMAEHFSAYPKRWGLTRPDRNIDHRRVPNLQTYFSRRGQSRKVTRRGADYWPGDVVTWSLSGLPHIGIVARTPAPDGTRFLVTHNIGAGTQTEDVLFAYPITGHYRCF
jgi:uncharacterized protein YijF (DUF1287 family)